MKVIKVINNNIISSVDDFGNEIIVMGCGIGFNAQKGDEIESKTLKRFIN